MEKVEAINRLKIGSEVKKFFILDLGKPYYIYGFILFLSSFLVSGYIVYEFNHTIQIPLVYLLNNPSIYPNDPFAATLLNYPSLLWRIVALLAHIIPLEPLLLTLFLLERLIVIYAAGKLARTFVGESKLAILGAIAIFALDIHPLLGSGTIVENYLEQTGFSIPFFLFAIASFYKSQPIWCAIWTAIGFNLNSMYGTYAITYLGAVFLFDSTYRQAWKKWLVAFCLFLGLAIPVILPTLSAFERNATDNHLWLIASKLRFSHHLYPLTWKWESYAKFAIVLCSLMVLLYQNRHHRKKLFKHGAIWTGVSLLWLLYAFLAAYIFKSPSMLVMHPARGTDLWYCLAGITVVSICALNVEGSKGKQRQILWAIAFITSILFWHSTIALYTAIAVNLIALIWKPVWSFILSKESSKRLALLITLGVFLIGLGSFHRRLVISKSMEAALIKRPSFNIENMTSWVNVNTSPNAIFLVSFAAREGRLFRALTKRSVFVTWKDASAILWERTFVQTWAERLKAIGFELTKDKVKLTEEKAIKELKSLYAQLTDEDVKRLKSRYPIDYWVVPLEHPSNLAIAFQNRAFKILALR